MGKLFLGTVSLFYSSHFERVEGDLQWNLLHDLFLFDLQKLYKEAYEQSKGNKMNYCETPKFQTDAALKNFSDVGISLGVLSYSTNPLD